jgi:hypothetical protein
VRRDEDDVFPLDDVLVRIRGERAVPDRLDAVGGEVGAGQHRHDPRDGERRRRVDAADARVRVRRADEADVKLPVGVDIVAVAAGAGDEARVFLAQDVLADAFACGLAARGEERHATPCRG